MATDKIKVAVRVRPFNRRGNYPGMRVWVLSGLIVAATLGFWGYARPEERLFFLHSTALLLLCPAPPHSYLLDTPTTQSVTDFVP